MYAHNGILFQNSPVTPTRKICLGESPPSLVISWSIWGEVFSCMMLTEVVSSVIVISLKLWHFLKSENHPKLAVNSVFSSPIKSLCLYLNCKQAHLHILLGTVLNPCTGHLFPPFHNGILGIGCMGSTDKWCTGSFTLAANSLMMQRVDLLQSKCMLDINSSFSSS